MIFVKLRHRIISGTSSPQVASASSTTGFRKNEIAAPEPLSSIEQKSMPAKSKKERNEEIREMYANGETLAAIAKGQRITISTVWKICEGVERKAGRKPNPKNPEKEKRNERITQEFADGMTTDEITKKEGIGRSQVFQICKGVERKVKPKRIKLIDPEKEIRNQGIREKYANGETLASIGKDYELTPSAVGLICKGVNRKAGKKSGPRPKPQEMEKRNENILERFINGETQREIAKDYGIDQGSVSRICKGVIRKVTPKRKVNIDIEKRNKAIRERLANGETLAAITKDFGLAQSTVYQICKGVERKEIPERGKKPTSE